MEIISMNVRFAGLLLVMTIFPCVAQAADVSCKTAECHTSIGGTQNMHEPVKEGDCSGCHKQTNPLHPLKGAKSFAMTAQGAALCYQCHDAFGKKKVLHPPVKDGECAYCHKPHGGVGPFLLEGGDDQTALCMGCHDAAPFKQKVKHGPVAVGACTKCHNPHESNEKALLRGPVWESCLKCHADFLKSLKGAAFIHPPVKDGPCTSCHNPHGSAVPQLLKKKMPDVCLECHPGLAKKLTAKVPHKPLQDEGGCGNCHSTHFSKSKGLLAGEEKDVCLGCHDTDKLGKPPLRNIKKEIEGKKFLHGPIEMGECKACHSPHGSDYFRLLNKSYPADLYAPYKEGLYDLCLECHEKNLLKFAETTIYTNFRNGKRNLHFVHVVDKRKGRTCRVCHEAHASSGEKLISKEGVQFGEWKIPLNFKITPTGGSCAPGCHRAFKYDRDKPETYGAETK
ncbi:cytochrome C [Oryzomonas japonica]|uniref:Cytochrome C n=2 Tax=Oryzomonas japonica TaxID=2603858 RepID=A0A7J4ZNT2_9BACT|nr:cytochrome C [Oryzomonas japonica]